VKLANFIKAKGQNINSHACWWELKCNKQFRVAAVIKCSTFVSLQLYSVIFDLWWRLTLDCGPTVEFPRSLLTPRPLNGVGRINQSTVNRSNNQLTDQITNNHSNNPSDKQTSTEIRWRRVGLKLTISLILFTYKQFYKNTRLNFSQNLGAN